MNRAKIERDVLLKLFNDAIDLLDAIAAKPAADVRDVGEVNDILNIVEVNWPSIESLSKAVQEAIPDTSTTDDLRDECLLLATARSRRVRAKGFADRFIKSFEQPKSPPRSNPRRAVKLPVLPIRRFNGNIYEWREFWASFEIVDRDEDLTESEKMRYLISYLDDEPRRTVENIGISTLGYREATRLLQEQYARTDLLINGHLGKLNNLKPVTSASDAVALRSLYNECEINVRALTCLGENRNNYKSAVAQNLFGKLPHDIRFSWTTDPDHKLTDLDGILAHLKRYVEGLERCSVGSSHSDPKPSTSSAAKPDASRGKPVVPTAAGLAVSVSPKTCLFCKSTAHNLFNCPMSIDEKRALVRRQARCLNCLGAGHTYDQCTSPNRCKRCNKNHHTSLHYDGSSARPVGTGPATRPPVAAAPVSSVPATSATVMGPTPSAATGAIPKTTAPRVTSSIAVVQSPAATAPISESSTDRDPDEPVGLATSLPVTQSGQEIASKTHLLKAASVFVIHGDRREKARLVLDDGSQRTAILLTLARRLGLKASGQELLEIGGIGGSADSLTRRPAYELTILPRGGSETQRATPFQLYAVGVETIPVTAPQVPDGDWLNEMKSSNLMLADEVYDSGVPGPIDIIIGADQYNLALHQRELVTLTNGITATNSVFGWVLTGGVDEAQERSRKAAAAMFINFRPGNFDEQILEDLRETWNWQSIGVMPSVDKPIPLEQHPVYEEFSQTVTKDGDRYEVQLPWKKNRSPLPCNLKLAERRLVGLLSRLRTRPELLQAYDGVFQDHLQRGFIEAVPESEVINPKHEVHYLSHHGVERKDKPSSPIRVVFNASAHENGSPSLNNLLEIGPKTQADQLEINLLFRVHRVAVTADIDKAFLQISLAEPDRDAVRFLWFVNPFDPKSEVIHYRYRRVAFGLGPSPFLLGAVLHHHLQAYDEKLPAVRALKRQRFVDDLISGAHTEQDALQLCRDARMICCEAGFPLGKFHSNSSSVREQLQPSAVSSEDDVPPVTKMLGLVWRLQEDDLSFDLHNLLEFRSLTNRVSTKRALLMTAHQLFDQMGLITPITVVSHIILQECWCRGLGWDDQLPADIMKRWDAWCDSLSALKQLFVPRWIFTNSPVNRKYALHVFCDASEKAYGVVAYLIREDGSPVLLTSRARVAPLERVTLARLELLACLIGARLQSYLRQVFDQFQFDVTMWSDSQVAINWIKTPTHRLKTFVANRVQEIQQLTQPGMWRHCAGVDNPADLCSRGSSADQLISSSLWWSGPEWLKSFSSSSESPVDSHDLAASDRSIIESEFKTQKVSVGLITADSSFSVWASRFSSLTQLLRVTAWIQRFISNWRKPAEERVTTELTADDIRTAKHWWIRRVQRETFPVDFRRLAKKKRPKQPSPLVGCGQVILSDDETICLQGRLGIESRPPNLVPILPSNHPLTSLLISDAHQRLGHSWVSITVDQLSHDYHILRSRQAVLKELKRCMRCRIMRTAPIRPPPGPLPAVRRTPGEPFDATGVDFFGPLYVKGLDHRSTYKVYGCLFTCTRTRAVHIEVVADLSTPTFLLALQRFIARRGRCSEIFSDNAKTFEKASRDIAAAFRRLRSCPFLKAQFASQGITWHFIPERAPWWGGFWERLVGVVKRPLRTIIGKACLTEAELTTKLIEVEATVNSRPLTHLSIDNRDPAPLSPAMLLNGRSPALLPPLALKKPSVQHYDADDCRDRFAYLESISLRFWKFFNSGYLRLLRKPLPGQQDVRTVEPGDFVLVQDDQAPRQLWKTGRVLQVHPSKLDGVIRSATIKTSGPNPIRRAVNHLYLLETVGAPVLATPDSSRPPVETSPAAAGSNNDQSDHHVEDGFETPDDDVSASDGDAEVDPEPQDSDADSDSSQEHQKSPSPTCSLGEEPVVNRTRSGRQSRPNRRYQENEWDLGRWP